MTKQVHGLNVYKSDNKKTFAFTNFQWVLGGKLARCSQPYYGGGDAPHTLMPIDVRLLKDNKIVCVISANSCDMSDSGKKLLRAAGIDFYNFKVQDFRAPTLDQLREAADLIEDYHGRKQNFGATLIYCGFGQGRTGTFVAAWAMSKHMTRQPGTNIEQMCTPTFLDDVFGVERPCQIQAVQAVATGRRLSQVSLPPMADLFGSSGSGSFHPGGAPSSSGPFGPNVPLFQPSSFRGPGGCGSSFGAFKQAAAQMQKSSMPLFANFGSGSSMPAFPKFGSGSSAAGS